MRLARKHFIITAILATFISSCAQVGTISGGDKDAFAPAVVHNKTNPPNKSVNFSGNEVSITFDEYFQLNKASENIVIIPPHATIKTKVHKKTLTLYWDDTLKENTTYSLYLNNAVADITEKNDSIIQYVFATGPVLDSLSYTTFVADSRTGKNRSNISVLLRSQDGDELISIGKTDGTGKVELQNLHPGTYSLIAIDDENKNMELDPEEEVGFHESEHLTIKNSIIDSNIIRLFPQVKDAGIENATFIEPSSVLLTATRPLLESDIKVDDQLIHPDQIRFFAEDSLLLFLKDSVGTGISISVKTELFADTIKLKLRSNRDESIRFVTIQKHDLAPSDKLFLEVNDLINTIDTSKISVYRKTDSSSVSFSTSIDLNRCYFEISSDNREEIVIELEEGAILCSHGESPSFSTVFNLLPERKFGTIVMDLSAYNDALVLSVLKDGKLLRSLAVDDPKVSLTLTELPPGDYSFSVILDTNKNGKWDTGDLKSRTQPEQIDRYTEASKVRANWEVKIPLNPQKQE